MSDYTFALWKGETLVEIGKAYSGLTDKEIAMLTEKFQALTLERRGRVHKVKPEVVLEVTFDGLQRSGRHASGLSLRFPRIVRIRDDKTAAEADKLEAAEALFNAQLESGHREDDMAEGNARGRDPFNADEA
jgi:DNA ligase 1